MKCTAVASTPALGSFFLRLLFCISQGFSTSLVTQPLAAGGSARASESWKKNVAARSSCSICIVPHLTSGSCMRRRCNLPTPLSHVQWTCLFVVSFSASSFATIEHLIAYRNSIKVKRWHKSPPSLDGLASLGVYTYDCDILLSGSE